MFSIPKSSAFIEGVMNLFFTRESNVCEISHLIICSYWEMPSSFKLSHIFSLLIIMNNSAYYFVLQYLGTGFPGFEHYPTLIHVRGLICVCTFPCLSQALFRQKGDRQQNCLYSSHSTPRTLSVGCLPSQSQLHNHWAQGTFYWPQ